LREKHQDTVEIFLPKFCSSSFKLRENLDSIASCICKHSKKCNICAAVKKPVGKVVDKVLVHETVRLSGKYNFEKCKIQVNMRINSVFMKRMLGEDYKDLIVCDLLKYGFPIGFLGEGVSFKELEVWKYKNHSGAEQFPEEINSYLEAESKNDAILGPFKSNPFSTQLKVSPLNSVPKKDTSERRVILDLSMPKGQAVNDFVDKNVYLGEENRLVFPKVDDFIKLVRNKGQGCLMFKKDLRKAYRQIPICPHDYNLVAFCWRKHIFCDTVLSMGLTSAASICQRVTTAVAYILFRIGLVVLNYLDDFAGVERKEDAMFAYKCLELVLGKCGLEESASKACEPSEKMVFLGVLFNSLAMTVEVTPDRLIEIKALIKSWLMKSVATLKEVQSLIGKLNFVAACVRPGRVFISRLINWLKELYAVPISNKVIPVEVYKDIGWWDRFLETYNGISIMLYDEWSKPDEIFSTDACLTGAGGFFKGKYFRYTFPVDLLELKLNICVLEMLGIIVALRLWKDSLKGSSIIIQCDNEAVCHVVNSGRAKCKLLQEGLREICYLTAVAQCQIRCVHIPGIENRLADCLSRWEQDDRFPCLFHELTKHMVLEECVVGFNVSEFLNKW